MSLGGIRFQHILLTLLFAALLVSPSVDCSLNGVPSSAATVTAVVGDIPAPFSVASESDTNSLTAAHSRAAQVPDGASGRVLLSDSVRPHFRLALSSHGGLVPARTSLFSLGLLLQL